VHFRVLQNKTGYVIIIENIEGKRIQASNNNINTEMASYVESKFVLRCIGNDEKCGV
jgi:hypothetical protein